MSGTERNFPVFEREQSEYVRGRRFIRGLLLPTLARLLRINVTLIDREKYLPATGRGLIMMNHRGGIDPLLLMMTIKPRYLVTMSKIENYDLPIFSTLMHWWGAYPVIRGEVDRRALEFTIKLLEQECLVLMAPEGTRQPALIEAKEGVAYLAIKTQSPIIPVGISGSREFERNIKRYRQTPVTIRFGTPFQFRTGGKTRVSRETMASMTREAMYQLAALIPPELRGVYADIDNATHEHIELLASADR